MTGPLKTNLLKYGLSSVLALGLAYVFIALRVDFSALEEVETVTWYLYLCDAFTVPGLLFLMFGIFMSLSNMGALDGLGYVLKNAVKMLIPGAAANLERYREYLEHRRANRSKGYGFLYVVGIVCMAVAGVFLVLFYSLYQP